MARHRIAVVEDSADNRLLVQALLGDLYDLTEYETGVDAIVGIVTDAPDLVLLDISLPAMDGFEVLARMRQDARLAGIPVVALTAHAMHGDRERCLAAGFNEYVTKPIVDERLLLDAIERQLRRTTDS